MPIGLITTKKNREALNERLNELEQGVSQIKNFNVVKKDLDEKLESCNRILNLQNEAFNKKIIETNSEVDSRISTFNEKINKLIDEYVNKTDAFFDKQRTISNQDKDFIQTKIADINQIINEHKSEIDSLINNKIKPFEQSIDESKLEFEKKIQTVDDAIYKFENEISLAKEDVVKAGNAIYEEEIKKIQDDYHEKSQQLVFEQSNIWNERLIEITNEFNQKIDKFIVSLKDMVSETFKIELNKVMIDEITNKSEEMILNSFNDALKSYKLTAKDNMVEALDSLRQNNLLNNVKSIKTSGEKVIKPIGENELFHSCYPKLKMCVESGIIPMIVGPAGTGKSTAAEQLSREMGLNFYLANRIQNTFELVGFVNAAGEYVTTQFYEAYTKGGVFLFDEVDASSPEALVTVNAAIAQGYMAFPGHPSSLPMHEDFKAICAGNTFGTGSTLQYTGRNKLDAATLDRFMIIEWDYDTALEDKLVSDKELLQLCWNLRTACHPIDQNIIISTRGIITLEKMLNSNKGAKVFEIKDLFRQKFFENISKEKIKKIYYAIESLCEGNKYLNVIKELYY